MKSSSPKRRRLRPLQAKASAINPSEFEDYGPEPNMKLSHAFMVVLALHIIAVGGLFAFNKMKINRAPLSLKSKAEHLLQKESVATREPSLEAAPSSYNSTSIPSQTNLSHQLSQASNLPVATQRFAGASDNPQTPGVTSNPPPSPPSTPGPLLPTALSPSLNESVKDSSKEVLREYTIMRGDNPYKLAKKFHVSYDALMKLNNIADPRKIQIGQKLKIPATTQVKAQRSRLKSKGSQPHR
jgi:LysM repeat protein